MTLLTALPNELLLIIYLASPTIQAAGHLSCVSRTLRDVWIKNSDRIIATVLEPKLPAYGLAVTLAVNEAEPSMLTSGDSAMWLPRLLRNADLSSSACAAMGAFVADLKGTHYRDALALTSFHVSYYVIRQLVLAYHCPALQPTLRSMLDAAPEATLREHFELGMFMCEHLDDAERTRQGMLKHGDWSVKDYVSGIVVDEAWQFAFHTISEVIETRD